MEHLRSTAKWLGNFVCWTLLLGSLLVLVLAVVVPRMAGATPYTVTTGSMDPTAPPGTLVVVKPKAAEELNAGDIITYQIKSGEPEVVTHRIIAVGTSLNDETFFRTQGDANDDADKMLVRPVQIRGAVWYKIPFLGYAAQLLSSSQRVYINYAVAAGLILFALFQFGGFFLERKRKQKHDDDQGGSPPADTPAERESPLPGLAGAGLVMSMVVAGTFLPSGAYWNTSRATVGAAVQSGTTFSCTVINANNGSPVSNTACSIALGSTGCPSSGPGQARVFLNIAATGVNGQGNNRAIKFRTSLKGMGCNPSGVNWTAPTSAGFLARQVFTPVAPFPCSSLPILEGQIDYPDRGANVRVGTIYFNRAGQTVSCT